MIRTATAQDVPALAAMLARAFYDDPVSEFAHPRARSRERRIAFFFRGRLQALVGEELCFCDAERRGCALWAPPDRWQPTTREGLRLLRLVNHRTPQLVIGFSHIERAHPRRPHYYLSVLGVEPAAQGQGLGSRLLAPMLERCDSEGVGAWLESSKERNVPFYERHGFRVSEEMRFPGGPPLWLMWRDPR